MVIIKIIEIENLQRQKLYKRLKLALSMIFENVPNFFKHKP